MMGMEDEECFPFLSSRVFVNLQNQEWQFGGAHMIYAMRKENVNLITSMVLIPD